MDHSDLKDRLEAVSEALAYVLRQRRISSGMTQEQLAEKSGMHRSYIGDVEKGARNISFKNSFRLSWALNVDCSELMTLSEEKVRQSVQFS